MGGTDTKRQKITSFFERYRSVEFVRMSAKRDIVTALV